MELSEGKLFTIEALNRIEGFEWPDGAECSAFDPVGICFLFYSLPPKPGNGEFVGGCIGSSMIVANTIHPDWKNSLITREEFESVDGWVRNDCRSIPDVNVKSIIDVNFRSGNKTWFAAGYVDFSHTNNEGDVMKWRHHKKQKQVNQLTQQPIATIETLISQHKAAKQSTLEARRLLEHAEAIEHNLLLSIEAWAESNGFDIRLLDESDEKPELVITDWRDLQNGDVVRWSVPGGNCDFTIDEIFRDISGGNTCASIISSNGSKFTAYPDEIKFIRRPSKGEK